MSEQEVVAVQIGRPLRSSVTVVSVCPLDLPVVVRVPPLLDDGTPFPTRFWLTCPLAQKRAGRLESIGGVKQMERHAEFEPEFGHRLTEAHTRYAEERTQAIPNNAELAPTGGVGGSATGVKCLHAHYADFRAGNNNPVGEAVAVWVEPLNCEIPCVVSGQRNPRWLEPR